MGPLHGYGIARRIEQIGKNALLVNQGTVYLVSGPAGPEKMDHRTVGDCGQQPEGEVLLHY